MILRIGTSGYSYKEWKGIFYPGRSQGRRHALLLRRAAGHGGDQQHLLPHAHEEAARGLGVTGARPVPLRPEGLPEDHPLQASQGVEEEVGVPEGDAFPRSATSSEPFLVQIPPNLKRDDERLTVFLELMSGVRMASRGPQRFMAGTRGPRPPRKAWCGTGHQRDRRGPGTAAGSHRIVGIPAPAQDRV